MPRYSAFLSYSRKDTDRVAPLKEAFENAGHKIWFDQTHIRGGDLWEDALRRGLTQSNCVLVAVTQNAVGSFVDKEISIARDMRKRIVPLLFDDALSAQESGAIAGLREIQYIDFRTAPKRAITIAIDAVSRLQLAPVIATYNRKGGVGKTTLTMNLAAYFFKRAHKRVLLIDFDPQTNLSTAMVRDWVETLPGGVFTGQNTIKHEVLKRLNNEHKNIAAVLDHSIKLAGDATTDFALDRYVHNIDKGEHQSKLDIVVGASNLDGLLEAPIKSVEKIAHGFVRFIEQCRAKYDCILIDLGPSKDRLSKCALSAATHVLSPVKPDLFGIQALNLLDDVGLETGAEAAGREQMIVINEAEHDPTGIVRTMIRDSAFGDALLTASIRTSNHFFISPQPTVNRSLSFLPAYGTWGPSPNAARQSLQNVAKEVGKRVGLAL